MSLLKVLRWAVIISHFNNIFIHIPDTENVCYYFSFRVRFFSPSAASILVLRKYQNHSRSSIFPSALKFMVRSQTTYCSFIMLSKHPAVLDNLILLCYYMIKVVIICYTLLWILRQNKLSILSLIGVLRLVLQVDLCPTDLPT